MLQLQKIKKEYHTGDLIQTALNDVSLNFRDNEFVAILGPSGSGKTTLLNIVGGLDRYDSGDLIINGTSTKKYRDRDWDAYRNHTIGFVFQSYNLIPHQNILSNVELALTISGISKSERRKRAKDALEKVGLIEHIHKRPNQLSGGQMQRVAIARALVNDPDILLADEPTGALDSETSVQVMDMLKEVAKDRLVIMVTHNPELAEQYSTRIVRLKDGRIISDSDPFDIKTDKEEKPQHKKMGKTSMSFFTSLALSFNNLRTKKGRTILTAFAGSIGIIGIALILSLSNGVNTYITDIQRDAMSSYPIKIDAQSVDLSALMETTADIDDEETTHKKDAVYSNSISLDSFSSFTSSITTNNLTDFKKYLDNPKSKIHDYIGENGIVYSYDTAFDVFSYDEDGVIVNLDGSTLNQELADSLGVSAAGGTNSMSSLSFMTPNKNKNISQILPGKNGDTVSKSIKDNYELVYGKYPEKYNEVVLVLNKNNEILLTAFYEMGILPSDEYKDFLKRMGDGEKIEFDTEKLSYKDICKTQLYLLPASDYYTENENGIYSKSESNAEIDTLIKNKAIKLKFTGVIRPNEDCDAELISTPIGYTNKLTDYLIKYAENSDVVKEQKKNKDINILTGMSFNPKSDDEKIQDVKNFFSKMGISDKAKLMKTLSSAGSQDMQTPQTSQLPQDMQTPQTSQLPQDMQTPQTSQLPQDMQTPQTSQLPQDLQTSQTSQLPQNMQYPTQPMQNAQLTEEQLSAQFDAYIENADKEVLLSMYELYVSNGSYDDNLKAFGLVTKDTPSSISIYSDSFENKDNISACIEDYNKKADETDKITYTDYVGLLMSSVTTIIDVISYVLIAFVSVSLVVSSIMIGIITYISVLERTKEIGILRAIGASKKNISQVFNAETFIIGLCSGIIGIGVTLLALIPANSIIHVIAESNDVNAALPPIAAIILIILSIILTLIGGLIPAKKAALQDPVKALRSD